MTIVILLYGNRFLSPGSLNISNKFEVE